ncbi:hypothetical protein B0T14DRAFT_529471 [Immersiella caudata]|uniref:Uncharacterized protein n=1 Tax=Immersiella caudata TaxID=314043 RepID=A0AA39TKU5_9PEZI|nr:hypothetical protein B0T14DRAFT_529471 [Immersiella caudata]
MVNFFPNKDKANNTNIGTGEMSGVINREILEKIMVLQKANQASFDIIAGEVKATQHRISALERHREVDAARAAIRHDIMFGVLKKVSHDINGLSASCLKQSTAADMEYFMKGEELKQEPGATPTPRIKSSQSRAATPRATKSDAKHMKQRGTMEHLLSDWTCKMNEAETVAEVMELGKLLVKYAEDLVKTYI